MGQGIARQNRNQSWQEYLWQEYSRQENQENELQILFKLHDLRKWHCEEGAYPHVYPLVPFGSFLFRAV